MRKREPALTSVPGRRIGVHDRQQFELKLEYQPSPGERESRYSVEAYLCVPGNLNLEPETVPPQLVYGDIHNYVRLKTPELSWKEIASGSDSPLARLERELDRGAASPDPFVYECKLFACIVRAALRDAAERVDAAIAAEGIAGAVDLVGETIDGVGEALRRYREAAGRVERARALLGERASVAWRLADEYASVSVEQILRRMILAVDRSKGGEAADRLKDRLLETILAEERHRKDRGYPSIIDPASDNEAYIYRAGLLKKFCSSALFLRIQRHLARRPWQELFFAVAAGIAMAFATVVAFWAQSRYSAVGFRLFVILIIAYMFKDRIKEGIRGIFARFLERHLYDRKIVIEDPAGGRLGICREKIEYLPPRSLPSEIREARRTHNEPSARIAEEELHETVIRYRKEITLVPRRITGNHHEGLTDILRFHVARLLHQMDEPDQEIEYVDLATRRIGPVRAAKVYHVDVVFRFTGTRGAAAITLVRLILDRRGIKRIVQVDGNETDDSTSRRR